MSSKNGGQNGLNKGALLTENLIGQAIFYACADVLPIHNTA